MKNTGLRNKSTINPDSRGILYLLYGVLICALLLVTMLLSCNNIEELSSRDFEWLPYGGNETLVFQSSTGQLDTIRLAGKDTMLGYADPLSLNGVKYEVVSVRHLEDGQPGRSFVELSKEKDGKATLYIDLYLRDAAFYRFDRIKIDSLKGLSIFMATRTGQRIKVYRICSDQAELYGNRNDFVTCLYWSTTNGLVRFDRKDGVSWELKKKY